MKTHLFLAATAVALLAACDARVETTPARDTTVVTPAPTENKTTIVNPPAASESSTTVVNPPPASTTESTTTTTTTEQR